MNGQAFKFDSAVDSLCISAYCWDQATTAQGVVVIAHGLGEHAGRYDEFAIALNGAGYIVLALRFRLDTFRPRVF